MVVLATCGHLRNDFDSHVKTYYIGMLMEVEWEVEV